MTEDSSRLTGVPRALLIIVALAAATITIGGIKGIADLAAPAFLALVLAVTVHPLRAWLQSHRWPSWLATVACIVVVYSILLGLALSLVVSIARFAGLLPGYVDDFNSLVDDLTAWLKGVGVGQEQIQALSGAFNVGQLAGYVTSLLSSVLGLASDLFFIVTLLLFMGLDGARFPRDLAFARRERPQFVDAMASFAVGTRTYLIVSTIFGLIVAVIDVGALWLLGIPVPLLWGLLSFITNYIPNIGFVIGLIPPAILGLLEGGPSLMLAVIAVYSVINVIIQSVIQPKFVGDAVGLSTSLTFLSLIFWAWVLGPLGALLAIPASLLVKALLVDVDPTTRWLQPLISGRPAAESAGESLPPGAG